MSLITRLVVAIFFTFTSGVVSAYVGPGSGLSAIGSVLALIGAVIMLIIGFLWYPIKRYLRGRKKPDNLENVIQNSDSEDK